MSERLFEPFVDAIDATACVSAAACAADIRALAAPHRLRFPLVLDDTATLRAQIEAGTHAPASSRFGPFCDNVLGMNWRLPSGRVVRIGERVVKTTTGYDWLRFLLHTGTRFGQPLDYVLRLRPDCAFTMIARFDGEAAALRRVVALLLRGGWMHWWDAVDVIAEADGARVRVTVHCYAAEASLFAAELERIADETTTRLTRTDAATPPCDGLPDVVLKTTPDRVLALAAEIAGTGVRAVGLCYSGVVHVHLDDSSRIEELIRPHVSELHAQGGDWRSRHLPAPEPAAAEAAWLAILEEAARPP